MGVKKAIIMRVSEAKEIVRGNLVGVPSISEFEGITSLADKVKRGWLFIAKDCSNSTLKKVLENGAYGIIYAKDSLSLEQRDEEIAWIEVDDIGDAVVRLVRDIILRYDISVVSFNKIQYAIGTQIIVDRGVLFSDGDFFALLESITPHTRYIMTGEQKLLTIVFNVLSLLRPLNMPFNLISYTLFDMRVFYNSKEYLLNMPFLFVDDLSALIGFCEDRSILFDMAKFQSLPFLKPNFIDSFGRRKEYGESQRVLIVEENLVFFEDYVRYLDKFAKWGKKVYLLPKDKEHASWIFIRGQRFLFYRSYEEIFDFIRNEEFNFMLILGLGDDGLARIFELAAFENAPSLFDGVC